MSNKYRNCVWFDGNALEAAEYYADVFPGVEVGKVSHYSDDQPDFNKHMVGKVLMVELSLEDLRYVFLNAGPEFPHSEYFSIEVMCADQAEVDLYWDRLIEDGGQESQCGWCKDKFGVSWQIVPVQFYDLMNEGSAVENAVVTAMYGMQKLIVADLEAAAEKARS